MENITLVLIFITIGVSIYVWSNPNLIEKLVFNPYKIQVRGEYYRLITSGFIHADWQHLFFNMLTLYFFGKALEYYYSAVFGPALGGLLYVALYLLSIALSDVDAFATHRRSQSFNSLGASGGVSAVVFGCILFAPLQKIYGMPGFIYGVLYLIYCSYGSRFSAQVNHKAHLWGSIIGATYTIVAYPPVISMFIEQIAKWSIF